MDDDTHDAAVAALVPALEGREEIGEGDAVIDRETEIRIERGETGPIGERRDRPGTGIRVLWVPDDGEDLLRVRFTARYERHLGRIALEVTDVTDAITGPEVEDTPRTCSDDSPSIVADVCSATSAEYEHERC
jgi:hypothetical protein